MFRTTKGFGATIGRATLALSGILTIALALVAHAALMGELHWGAWAFVAASMAGIVALQLYANLRRFTIEPPQQRSEAWGYRTLALFLLFQAFAPLHYYLGEHPWDERFAWRMYSAVRVARCQLQSFETHGGEREQTRISEHIHVAYASNIQRNRPRVAEAYLRWRCEQDDDLQQAEIYNTCIDASGELIEPRFERRIFCESAFIERSGP